MEIEYENLLYDKNGYPYWVIGNKQDGASYFTNSGVWAEYDEAGYFTHKDFLNMSLSSDGYWISMKSFVEVLKANMEVKNEEG